MSQTNHCAQLQDLWHTHFPLARAMSLTVTDFSNHRLEVHAPLAANTNIHDTAFAGSLYAIQAMAAWGVIYLECTMLGLEVSIIHASGQIDFARTVEQDIVAEVDFREHLHHLQTLQQTGKMRLDLEVKVCVGGENASTFSGNYAVRRVKPERI